MKIIKYSLFFSLFFFNNVEADINKDFEIWKKKFKNLALSNKISEQTFDLVIKNNKYLPDVIKYDRYAPNAKDSTYHCPS